MAEHDEFAAWAAESWRSSARWDEVISQLHNVVTKLAGDLRHTERQLWQARNTNDTLYDIAELLHQALISGDNYDRVTALEQYDQLRKGTL